MVSPIQPGLHKAAILSHSRYTGETPIMLNEDGMMSLGRDAGMFRGVVTVLQNCDRIASGDATPAPQLNSMTPDRLTGVYERVFGAGMTGREMTSACERGMQETRFYTE